MNQKPFIFVLLVTLLSACQTPWFDLKNENARNASENAALAAENEELRAQLRKLGHDIDDKTKMITSIQERDAERQRELERLRKTLAGTGIDVRFENGQAVLTLPNTILFDSGNHVLKKESKKALETVVGLLNGEYKSYTISVEGHTDSDPIAKSKDRYEDNYDLSANRARAVLNYLADKGVTAERLRGGFYGSNKPIGSNADKTGKAKNRRVEIVLIR